MSPAHCDRTQLVLLDKDSFYNILLDGPHYTRPRNFNGMKVPDVLISGNHKKIKEWKFKKKLNQTKSKRPDLYKKYLKSESQKVE